MKHTQAKYWCINLLFSLLLISCTSEANKENIEVTKKLTEKKDTVINLADNLDYQNDSIEESFQKDTSLVAKENTKNTTTQSSIKKDIGPQSLKPVYVMMSEKKYWEWRKSNGYFNDSVGQRKVLLYELSSLSMDSLEKEKKWKKHWNTYIEKKEKHNVIWNDSLRNIQNNPDFYKKNSSPNKIDPTM